MILRAFIADPALARAVKADVTARFADEIAFRTSNRAASGGVTEIVAVIVSCNVLVPLLVNDTVFVGGREIVRVAVVEKVSRDRVTLDEIELVSDMQVNSIFTFCDLPMFLKVFSEMRVHLLQRIEASKLFLKSLIEDGPWRRIFPDVELIVIPFSYKSVARV
jgi:hypothetical protein